MRKNIFRITFGLLVSTLFIYLSIKNVSIKRVAVIFKGISNPYFYLSFTFTCILTLLAMFFRGIRWKYLITFSNLNPYYLFLVENFGDFINYILPGKVGEFAKSYIVSDDNKLSFSSVFATVFVERVLDLLFILSLGLFIPTYLFKNSNVFIRIRFFSLVLLLFTFVFIFLLFVFKKSLSVRNKRNRFFTFLYLFIEGLSVLKKPLNILICIVSTFFVWFFTAFSIFVLYKGMNIFLPFFNAIITLYLFTLGITIPSSPGDIGPFHFFVKISLTLFGIEPEKALTFAITYHLSQFLSVIPIGLFVTIKKGFKWR